MQVSEEEDFFTKSRPARPPVTVSSTVAAAATAVEEARRDWADALLAAGVTGTDLPELELLQEQQRRLERVCDNFDKLFAELQHGREVLQQREEELQEIEELQKSVDQENVEEEEIIKIISMTEENQRHQQQLKNRLEEQYLWLLGRRQWLGRLSEWILALMRATELKQLDEAELNHLDDWFAQLRADISSADALQDMDANCSSTRPRRRVTDSPYLLRWLDRAISNTSCSNSNLSSLSIDDMSTPPQLPPTPLQTDLSESLPPQPPSINSARLPSTNDAYSVHDDWTSSRDTITSSSEIRRSMPRLSTGSATTTPLLPHLCSSMTSIELTDRLVNRTGYR